MRAYDLTVSGSLVVSGSTTLTGDITYDDLTATGNIVTTGASKVISGSSTSTGSFGYLNVDGQAIVSGMANSNLVNVSSSLSTRVSNLKTDSGSFSTRISTEESNVDSLQTDSGSFSTRVSNLKTDSGSFSTRITDNNATGSILAGTGNIQGLGSTNNVQFNHITASSNISASGNLYLSGTADIDGNVDIDNTTTTIDSSDAISLDAGAASNFTTTAGALTLEGKTGVDLKENGTSVITIDTNQDTLFASTGGSTSDPDVEFDGYVRFDGVTEVADSTDSTSVTTGALIVDGGVGIAKDLVVGGMVTAQEFHSEFVSASIMYISGSNKFGDTIDDNHSFTGSINQSGSFNLNDGNMTITDTLTATNIGAFTSTGAIDFDSQNMTNVDIDSGTIDGTTIGAASHTTIKGTTIDATTDFTIDGLVITADTITNDATLTIDGANDMVIDVDGGNLDIKDDGVALLNISATKVSGSVASSGSFGRIDTVGDIYASGRIYEAGTSVVDHATAMAIVFGG